MSDWLVINVGCLECEVDTLVYGPFASREEALVKYEECRVASYGGTRPSLWKYENGQYLDLTSEVDV